MLRFLWSVEFLVVTHMRAEDVVTVVLGQALEIIEIVPPFLDAHKPRPINSPALRNSRLDGLITIGVFGPVLLPAEIPTDFPAAIEFKTIHQATALKGRR